LPVDAPERLLMLIKHNCFQTCKIGEQDVSELAARYKDIFFVLFKNPIESRIRKFMEDPVISPIWQWYVGQGYLTTILKDLTKDEKVVVYRFIFGA
jgi:hypothetical protein